jgi:hypothetical protein
MRYVPMLGGSRAVWHLSEGDDNQNARNHLGRPAVLAYSQLSKRIAGYFGYQIRPGVHTMRPYINITIYSADNPQIIEAFIICYSAGSYSCYVGHNDPTYVPMNAALFQEWLSFSLYRHCPIRVSMPLAAPSGRHPVYQF